MKRPACLLLFLLLLPASLWAAAPSRTTDFAALLSGRIVPLSVKLGQLDSTWRRFTILGAQSQGSSLAMFGLPSASPTVVYYSKGQTASAVGESFLVAYAADVKLPDATAALLGRGGEMPEPVTADTPLQLTLLNVHALSNLTGIKPFDLKAELASYQQAYEAVQSAIEARGSMTEGESSDSNLKNLTLAIVMYYTDYDAMPPFADVDETRTVLEDYVKNDEVFNDPTGEPYQFNASLSGKTIESSEDMSKLVVVYQAAPGEDDQREVGFADGHVRKVSAEEWGTLQAESGLE
jgi:hypothetical protein